MCTTDLDGSRSVDRSINSECGIHVSYDIIPGFLEGSLGMNNITV